MKTVACPDCEGFGRISALVKAQGGPCAYREVNCRTCDGVGLIDPAVLERHSLAERRRRDRIARGVSLRDEAAALGITPQKLSDIEHGRQEAH